MEEQPMDIGEIAIITWSNRMFQVGQEVTILDTLKSREVYDEQTNAFLNMECYLVSCDPYKNPTGNETLNYAGAHKSQLKRKYPYVEAPYDGEVVVKWDECVWKPKEAVDK